MEALAQILERALAQIARLAGRRGSISEASGLAPRCLRNGSVEKKTGGSARMPPPAELAQRMAALREETAQDNAPRRGDGRRVAPTAMDETTSTLLPHDRCQDTVRGGTIGVAVEQGFESLPMLVRDHHRRGLPDNCDRPGGAVPATGMITDEAMQAGVSDLFSELVCGYDYDLLGRINFFIAIHGRDERCVSGDTINREPGDETDLVPGQIYTDAILAQFTTFGVQDHNPISMAHRDNAEAGTLQAKSDTPEC